MPETRIHVDFNDVEDDGRIVALRRHADNPSAVHPGAVVELWDEDGNAARGRISELQARDIVLLDIMWDTWRTADASPVARSASILRYSWRVLRENLATKAPRVTVTTSAGMGPASNSLRPRSVTVCAYGTSPAQRTRQPAYGIQSVTGSSPRATVR